MLNGHILASGMERARAEQAAAVAARLSERRGRKARILSRESCDSVEASETLSKLLRIEPLL